MEHEDGVAVNFDDVKVIFPCGVSAEGPHGIIPWPREHTSHDERIGFGDVDLQDSGQSGSGKIVPEVTLKATVYAAGLEGASNFEHWRRRQRI